MKITITPVTSWERAINAARLTEHKPPLGKHPSFNWIMKSLRAQHSPIRLREYDIIFEDVPHHVMTHLVRHFIGCIPFVATSRTDRTDEATPRHEQRKDDPCTFQLSVNAQSLLNISELRLCHKAEDKTREVWQAVLDEMRNVDPAMASAMVPRCIRLGGHCPEYKPCGKNKSEAFKKLTELYWYETKD